MYYVMRASLYYVYLLYDAQTASKDVPEWMKYSTVHPSGDLAPDTATSATATASSVEYSKLSTALPGQLIT